MYMGMGTHCCRKLITVATQTGRLCRAQDWRADFFSKSYIWKIETKIKRFIATFFACYTYLFVFVASTFSLSLSFFVIVYSWDVMFPLDIFKYYFFSRSKILSWIIAVPSFVFRFLLFCYRISNINATVNKMTPFLLSCNSNIYILLNVWAWNGI